MIAYKFLRPDGTSKFTGFRWDLPDGKPGRWVDARANLCRSGVHACRASELPLWAGQTLYEIELDGEIVEGESKLLASRGRLLRRLDAWDEGIREAYTRMCAVRAHELASSVTAAPGDWDAVIDPAVPEGPALLGFVAARIAEEISGREGYWAERARQASWLTERLGLDA